EISQLLVLVLARPVRLGDLLQLGGQLRQRPQGTPRRRPVPGPCPERSVLDAADPARRRNRADVERAERGHARVLPQGLRDRGQALESLDRARRLPVPPEPALIALPALDRRLGGTARESSGRSDRSVLIREKPAGLDPERSRQGVRALA